MKVNDLTFGSITIDGEVWSKDVIIDNGTVKKRKKGESKQYREIYGHTPLSPEENIPWKCIDGLRARKVRIRMPRGVKFDFSNICSFFRTMNTRSASLTVNLILSALDVNGIPAPDGLRTVDLAQAVENDYIGSPCGKLDQIMIVFAKAGMGTQ